MNKKILFLFACAYFFFFSSVSSFANENLATNYYVEIGKELFEKKNYDLAIVEFNKALLADPNNEEALMYLRMLGFGSADKKDIAASREQGQSAQSVGRNKKVKENTSKVLPVKAGEPDKNLTVEEIEAQIAQEEKTALESLRAEFAQKEQKTPVKTKAIVADKRTTTASKTKVKKIEAKKTEVKKLKVEKTQVNKQEVESQEVAPDQITPEQFLSQEVSPQKVVQEKAVQKPVLAADKPQVVHANANEDISLSLAKCENVQEEPAKNMAGSVVQKPQSRLTKKEQQAAAIKVIEKETAQEKVRIHQEFAKQKSEDIRKIHAKYKGKPIGKNEKVFFQDINGDGVKERVSSRENKAIEKAEIAIDKKEKEAVKSLEKKAAQKEKTALKKLHDQNASAPESRMSMLKAGDVMQDPCAGQVKSLSVDQDENFDKSEIKIPAVQEDAVSADKVLTKQASVKSAPKRATVKNSQADLTDDVVEDVSEDVSEEQSGADNSTKKKDVEKSKDSVKKQTVTKQKVDQDNVLDKTGDVVIDKEHIEQPAVLVQNQVKADENQGEVQVPAVENKQDLAQKEAELHKKFEVKKAAMILEAQKASLEKSIKPAEVQNIALSADKDKAATNKEEESEIASLSSLEEKQVTKPVENENVVLKKKLGEIIDMAQQDQKTIQDLEQNVKKQNDKVEVLETDLVETKQALESKKEELKEQSVKLKDLQTRIAAMETDVHSKQYDFKDKQLEYEKKLQAIEEEFGNYKSQKAKNEEELQDQLKILKEALAKKIAELNEAQERLIFVENKLAKTQAEHAATLKQYEDLKKTMGDLESRLTDLPAEIKTDKMPSVELDVKNLPAPKNSNEFMYQQWIQRHDKLIAQLKEKLLWAREQMDYLGRYDIKLSDQKMAALKEQLAAVKQQLSVQNSSGGQKSQEYALMEERLKDAQQRLEMVEKILREKDEQVQELEKQLNGVLSAF